MSFRQNGYTQQQQSNDDYIVAFVNERGDPIIWEDRNRRLWAYNNRNEFVEVDERGNEINNYPPQYQDGYDRNYGREMRLPGGNQSQNQNMTNRGSVGGNRYGNSRSSAGIGIGHSSPSRHERSERVEKPAYKPRGNYREEVKKVEKEVVVMDEKPILLFDAGYRAEVGSEMVPYFDESIYELDVIVDDTNKTYKFITKRKG